MKKKIDHNIDRVTKHDRKIGNLIHYVFVGHINPKVVGEKSEVEGEIDNINSDENEMIWIGRSLLFCGAAESNPRYYDRMRDGRVGRRGTIWRNSGQWYTASRATLHFRCRSRFSFNQLQRLFGSRSAIILTQETPTGDV